MPKYNCPLESILVDVEFINNLCIYTQCNSDDNELIEEFEKIEGITNSIISKCNLLSKELEESESQKIQYKANLIELYDVIKDLNLKLLELEREE